MQQDLNFDFPFFVNYLKNHFKSQYNPPYLEVAFFRTKSSTEIHIIMINRKSVDNFMFAITTL